MGKPTEPLVYDNFVVLVVPASDVHEKRFSIPQVWVAPMAMRSLAFRTVSGLLYAYPALMEDPLLVAQELRRLANHISQSSRSKVGKVPRD